MRRTSFFLLLITMLSLLGCSSKEGISSYNLGLKLKQQGKLDEALSFFEQALLENYQLDEIYYHQADIYFQQNKLIQAYQVCCESIQLQPKNGKAYLLRGLILLAQKKWTLALQDYQKIISENPKEMQQHQKKFSIACYHKAQKESEQQKFKKALVSYNKAIALDPENALFYEERGRLYFIEKQYHSAIEDATEALLVNPKSVKAYKIRGLSKFAIKEFTSAAEDFTEALAHDSQNALLYYYRGKTKQGDQNIEGALSDYSKAIKCDDSNIKFFSARGSAYYEMNNFEEALADYTAILKRQPKDVYAYYNCSLVKLELKDFLGAETDASVALKMNPTYFKAWINRGIARFELKKYHEAVEDYSQAIEINPKSVDAYYGRGVSYYTLKKYTKAIDDYSQALLQEPKNAKFFFNRGLAYLQEKQPSKALLDFTHAIQCNPEKAHFYHNRGSILQNQGDLVGAIEDYSEAILREPQFIKAYLNRGLAYQAQNKIKEALSDYQSVLFIEPKYALAYFQRGDLFAQQGNISEAVKAWAAGYTIKLPEYRQLAFKNPITLQMINSNNFRSLGKETLAKKSSLHKSNYWRQLEDLGEKTKEFLKQEILGLYDSQAKKLYLIEHPSEKKQMLAGDDFLLTLTQRYRATLCHEMLHALTDQHFDFHGNQSKWIKNEDQELAYKALIEGEAMFVTYLDLVNTEEEEHHHLLVQKTSSLLESLLPTSIPVLKTKSFKESPLIVRETLMFPYLYGLTFCKALTKSGNWNEVNKAYQSPPLSTEQILHPEKFFNAKRDNPTLLSFNRDFPLPKKNWELLKENVHGEFGIEIFFRPRLNRLKSSLVAAGWDGDLYRLYQLKGSKRTLFVWASTWDSKKDAAEFVKGLAEYYHLTNTNKKFSKLKGAPELKYLWKQKFGFSAIWQRDTEVWFLDQIPKKKLAKIAKWSFDVTKTPMNSH